MSTRALSKSENVDCSSDSSESSASFLKESPQLPVKKHILTFFSMESIIVFLLIGLIAGWIAAQIVTGHSFGLVGNIVVGIVGAFIGGFLFRSLGVGVGYGFVGSVVMAALGAIVLLALARLVRTAP